MTKDIKPAAWIDNSGHPKHVLYYQSATERKLYGPLQPLYGQADLDAAVAAERKRWRALLADVDILAMHSGADSSREWHSVGCWLRPGQVLAHMDAPGHD